MEWRPEAIKRLIQVGLILSGLLGMLFLLFFAGTGEAIMLILGMVFGGIFLGFLLRGLRNVPEEQRWAIQLLGKYYTTVGPGLVWICPFLMEAREAVSLWEQRYPLFEKPIKIDFINGSATPKDAFAFVQLIGAQLRLEAKTPQEQTAAETAVRINVYKMVYAIKNVKGAATSLVENAIRSYLNSLTVEQGITEGRAGYDLIQKMEKETVDGIKSALANWGIELHKVIVADYDLDPAIIEAREAVLKAERAAVAARSRALQKALESGGMHGEIKKILVDTYKYPPEEAEKLAQQYVQYWKGSEEKVMTHWKFEGGEGILPEIAKIVAIIEAAKKPAK